MVLSSYSLLHSTNTSVAVTSERCTGVLVLVISKRTVRERMVEMVKNEPPSHWWWLDSHSNSKRSPWLQSALAELNEKTKAMLKLIEEDADSFAQRAEMYYKKRPQLVGMVEDFYRAHRSLAERCDQVAGIRLLKTLGSPFASPRYHQSEKLISSADYDSYSESCGVDESLESDVDDPEHEEEQGTKFDDSIEEEEDRFETGNDKVMRLRKEIERLHEENKAHKDQIKQKHDNICGEVMMLRGEIERLGKENRVQKDELKQKDAICGEVMRLREEIERIREENREQKNHLKQKDQEKIEVIRHLSLAIDLLKQENVKMRSFIAKMNKWKNPFEFNKLVGTLKGKLFNGITWNQPSIVAL